MKGEVNFKAELSILPAQRLRVKGPSSSLLMDLSPGMLMADATVTTERSVEGVTTWDSREARKFEVLRDPPYLEVTLRFRIPAKQITITIN